MLFVTGVEEIMMYIVGLGLSITSMTIEAIAALLACRKIYVDTYTSTWFPDIRKLVHILKAMGRNTELCNRDKLEGTRVKDIIEEARREDICIAVPGDPMFATTHHAIVAEAIQHGVEVRIITSTSIINAVYDYSCLQPYRFGKITTVVSPKDNIFFEYPIHVIKDNMDRNLHTILLLEIDLEKHYFMDPQHAVKILLEAQSRIGVNILKSTSKIIVLSAISSANQCIEVRTIEEVLNGDYICKTPPYTIIIPAAKLHPIEEECLEHLRRHPSSTLASARRILSSNLDRDLLHFIQIALNITKSQETPLLKDY